MAKKDIKIYDFCFIISDLLSTTPRAYRAILSLLEQGYSVFLSCNVRRFEAYNYHKELIVSLEKFNFSYNEIHWKNTSFHTVFFKIIHKLIRKVHEKISITNKFLLSLSNDYTIKYQYFKNKNVSSKQYVGHRPASLYAITKLARKYNSKIWFDIEDFHFDETTNPNENRMISEFIKAFSTKEINYTNASKLIGEAYLKVLDVQTDSIEILNSPVIEVFPLEKKTEELSFVWFSQTVTFKRGLEYFLEAINELKLACRIDLVGTVDIDFKKYIENLQLSNFAKINFHGFISEKKINEFVYNADVGLALELYNLDRNKNLAISNKILTYTLLGNYILATRTEGQVYFMDKIPKNGILCNLEKKEMIEKLQYIQKNKIIIRQNKQMRLEKSKILIQEKVNYSSF